MRIIHDSTLCFGCGACSVACADNNNLSDINLISRVVTKEEVKDGCVKVHHSFITCRQCIDPLCLKACKNGAIYKNKDSIVIVDREKCTGCNECMKVCPFNAIKNIDGKALKCSICEEMSCIKACPLEAITLR